jgi:hypothetical protein
VRLDATTTATTGQLKATLSLAFFVVASFTGFLIGATPETTRNSAAAEGNDARSKLVA